MIKAADMMIARRADTKARADFATWKMMAKLNGASALPAEAQTFLVSYKELLKQIRSRGERRHHPADVPGLLRRDGRPGHSARRCAQTASPATDNVTAFTRPAPQRPSSKTGPAGQRASRGFRFALIFACLVVVYVGFRYYWR